jgi:hypothetical protein
MNVVRGRTTSDPRIWTAPLKVVDAVFVGVDIDRKVEEVRQERHDLAVAGQLARLQHVDAFEDQDVRPVDGRKRARHDVIGQVRIERRLDGPLAGLYARQEPKQRAYIIAIGKSLALHQVFAAQDLVGQKEAVGGDEIDLGAGWPARQQLLQHACGGRFADRDRTGDADDERRLGDIADIEEFTALTKQQLACLDMRRQQPR